MFVTARFGLKARDPRNHQKKGHGSLALRFFDEQNADGPNSSGPGNGRDRLGSRAGRRPVVGSFAIRRTGSPPWDGARQAGPR